MNLKFAGGKIVDLERRALRALDVYVSDGRIVEAPSRDDDWKTVDCSGDVLMPGFIDLYAQLEDPERDSRCAVAGGFSQVVLDSSTPGVVDTPTKVREMRRRLEAASVEVHIAGAPTEGLGEEALAEMGGMVAQGCRVLSLSDVLIRDANLLRNILAYGARFGVPLFLRAGEADWEDRGVMREGPRSIILGLAGIPTESEEVGLCRLVAAVRLTGARVHVSRIWTSRGVEVLRRAKAEGLPITGSTTIHHLAMSDRAIEEQHYMGTARWVPPLGDSNDRAALLAALRDGTLDAVATDHKPLAPHKQMLEFEIAQSGAVGLQTAFPLLLQLTGDLVEVGRYLCEGPARVLGVDVPEIKVGRRAEFSVVNVDAEWRVDESSLHSRTNTPILGETVSGMVKGMVIGGDYLSA